MTTDQERRAAPRLSIQVPAEYEYDKSPAGTGFTENVSSSGVLVEHTSAEFPIDTELRMRFSFFQGAFDIVFTDLRMPGLDGLALIDRVRTGGHAVPCVLMTGNTDLGELRTRGVEPTATLLKPFEFHRMQEIIEELSDHRSHAKK